MGRLVKIYKKVFLVQEQIITIGTLRVTLGQYVITWNNGVLSKTSCPITIERYTGNITDGYAWLQTGSGTIPAQGGIDAPLADGAAGFENSAVNITETGGGTRAFNITGEGVSYGDNIDDKTIIVSGHDFNYGGANGSVPEVSNNNVPFTPSGIKSTNELESIDPIKCWVDDGLAMSEIDNDGAVRWSRDYISNVNRLDWHSTIGYAGGVNLISVSMFSDTGQPSLLIGAGNKKSPVYYVQYGESWQACVKVLTQNVQTYDNTYLARTCWTPNAGDTDNDVSYAAIKAVTEQDGIIPESIEIIKGKDAKLNIRSVFDFKADGEEAAVKFYVKVIDSGSDYFSAGGKQIINVSLVLRGLNYLYKFLLPAARGINGALVLQNLNEQGEAEAELTAVIDNDVPVSGSTVRVTSEDGNSADMIITARKLNDDALFPFGYYQCSLAAILDSTGVPKSTGAWAMGAELFLENGAAAGIVEEVLPSKVYLLELAKDGEGNDKSGKFKKDISGFMASADIDGVKARGFKRKEQRFELNGVR